MMFPKVPNEEPVTGATVQPTKLMLGNTSHSNVEDAAAPSRNVILKKVLYIIVTFQGPMVVKYMIALLGFCMKFHFDGIVSQRSFGVKRPCCFNVTLPLTSGSLSIYHIDSR